MTAQVVDLEQARARRVEKEWVTGKELAKRWRCSVRTLERWRRDHGLPAEKSEHTAMVRYWVPDCEAWFRGQDRGGAG